jgi:phenylalanyl-tRNA synthetase alpha subunit
MSERVDKFCNDLRDHLNAVEGHLGQIKQRLDTSGKESRAAIETKVGEAKAKLDAQRQKVDKAKEDAKNRIEEKKAETTSKIEEWKTNREQHKLEKRADRCEDYAAACIFIAADSVAEADLATLEAIEARLLAEEFSAER